MAHCRLNADLQRDTADRESCDPAVAQCELQRSSLEGGHSEFVEHELVVSLSEFGHKFESLRSTQEPGLHRVWIIDALPCHGHSGLERAHPLSWQ
jgi:hypothetical protein